ncbi:LysM peptidoglycan-binding domain-containing protein [Marinomonas mediterranea]|jgi:LysM domain.|uniref:Peptidoglycan-binding lysin domain n=1 Tax=Marinomonas mediterranea (strain ATCC 700492 / JCM 21426 / NBRC 103028 / MMB-1) TaxID=717774 RepID=F2JYB1_MARM1|nr:LysM peptidoglycan-binding domain-containing protein [Marinomonas mediterranea]ADZ91942.1 Peptidoglycan-binding lysin domain [Marinomonas mediterranea MMB-1]WCN09895.1 LysM peptidoglycan-binding domain-containing protein [Marinomonas mediterranea]WCN18025.1 LysM peptidoglycan-binding domain-containing protein [Marinomonas mediterranea MMB-1]
MKTVLKYTVQPGDSLSKIADQISASAGITTDQIEAANPSVVPSALQIGQLLTIPQLDTPTNRWFYTVLSGDSFSGIAAALAQCKGLTYEEIEQDNSLTGSTIDVGQVLNIPATSSDAPTQDNLAPNAINMGYWNWTWSGTSNPSNATLSLAFSGWTDPTTALQDSHQVKPSLVGTKYLTFGGGNDNGKFTALSLQDITSAIQSGKLEGYEGVAYDVEEGDSHLENDFAVSFKAAKDAGLKVLVTVSHSAPYGITDADALMQSFFADSNIDLLSPQLYTEGDETENDYQTTSGTSTTWEDYASAKAAIVPSIVTSDLYDSATGYFTEQGVTLAGYIQWAQV